MSKVVLNIFLNFRNHPLYKNKIFCFSVSIISLLIPFIISLSIPYGFVVWILYLLPLFTGYYLYSYKALVPLAFIIVILMVLRPFNSGLIYIPFDISIYNRSSGIIVFFILTILMRNQKKIKDRINNINKELEQKVLIQDISIQEGINKLTETIKELKLKDLELEISKDLYQTTINSLQASVYYIDKNFKYVLVNEAYIELKNLWV